jgi:hypothetical protein
MLHLMEQPGKNLPSASAQSFAGLLASLAAPERNGTERATIWYDQELADDVLTLSDEGWLRPQAVHEGDANQTSAVDNHPAAKWSGSEAAGSDGTSRNDLRESSVTIRLSNGENTRLRQRAREAGLTVSAYVRSCVLETDTLRAQVKQALAEMKSTADNASAVAPARKPWLGWMGRIRKRP